MPKDLGPEMFCNDEETIISWKGENFYKACSAQVRTMLTVDEGAIGLSYCVKREGHPGNAHEDFDGYVRVISENG